MNDLSIQSRTDYFPSASTDQSQRRNHSFRNLLDEIETSSSSRSSHSSAAQADRSTETQDTAATGKRRGWSYTEVEKTESVSAESAASEESSETTASTEYYFEPGFFEFLQGLIEAEKKAGNDPETTMDGAWRYYDSAGNKLSEPIPLDIAGQWETDSETGEEEWVGGPNPYTAYWLDDAKDGAETVAASDTEQVGDESTATAASDTQQSRSTATSGEAEDTAEEETEYRFGPQFFETIIGMVADEIQQGRDPNSSMDGTWRYYDSYGTPLPTPIPLDIQGGYQYNFVTGQMEWVGGENPYDLYWLEDAETVAASDTEQAGDESTTTAASDTQQSRSTATSGEAEDTAEEETEYRFGPQFFETIIGMVADEIQQGRDPNSSMDGTWRYYDSYGTPLPTPIPLDIQGGFKYNFVTNEMEWVGGENPYDLYWLNDDQSAAA